MDPEFGHDLQKITDEANKRLPLIWWYDLDADVKAAQDGFKALTEGSENEDVISGKIVEVSLKQQSISAYTLGATV